MESLVVELAVSATTTRTLVGAEAGGEDAVAVASDGAPCRLLVGPLWI